MINILPITTMTKGEIFTQKINSMEFYMEVEIKLTHL